MMQQKHQFHKTLKKSQFFAKNEIWHMKNIFLFHFQ